MSSSERIVESNPFDCDVDFLERIGVTVSAVADPPGVNTGICLPVPSPVWSPKKLRVAARWNGLGFEKDIRG
jgi:hypothetical protein